jgi:hypothetical protein
MSFVRFEFDDAGPDDVIEVSLSGQANVRLLDPSNFQSYRSGRTHRYFGGLARVSPFRLRPPHRGRWFVVVDMAGYRGSVRASARLLSAA